MITFLSNIQAIETVEITNSLMPAVNSPNERLKGYMNLNRHISQALECSLV